MRKSFFVGLLLSALCLDMFAGTTGNLQGIVTDNNNAPLPGVVITVTSPNLIGKRSAVSDGDGAYRIALLPPGNYEITASLTGFKTHKGNFRVSLDTTTTYDASLEVGGVEEVITVTSSDVIIDSTSTTIGHTYSDDYFEELPTARNINSLINLAPGVTGNDGSGGIIVYGSSGPESNYIIDGQNTTGLEYGLSGKSLNFDFVQEVQVKTGGYEAEFGRSTGAVVNVLTKSGGNQTSGTVFAYYRDADFYADAKEPEYGSTFLGNNEQDYGFTLGGYFIKDKLWYFVALNPNSYEAERSFQPYNTFRSGKYKNNDDLLTSAFKLTYNINENNNLVFNVLGDPRETEARQSNGDAASDRVTDTGGYNFQLKYTSVLSDSLILDLQVGQHNEEQVDKPLSAASYGTAVIGSPRAGVSYQAGGLGFYQDQQMKRDSIKANLEGFFGTHNAKFGIDYEDNKFDSLRSYGDNGFYVQLFGANSAGLFSRARIVRSYAEINAEGEIVRMLSEGLNAVTHTVNTAFFLQDNWEVTPRLMVKAGIRYEIQDIQDDNGNSAIKLDTNWAPRLGITYDVVGNGKSKLYASYGKFYESVPLDINNRAFGHETLGLYWRWDISSFPDEQRTVAGFDPSFMIGADGQPNTAHPNYLPGYEFASGGITPVADNLKGQGLDEILAGFEYEFKPNWSAGIKYIDKGIFDVIEDVSFDGGHTYIIANPGRDIEFTWGGNYDIHPLNGQGESIIRNGEEFVIRPGDHVVISADESGFNKPKRDFTGFELSLKRAFSNNYSFNVYYLWSELKGDYIGLYLPFYGQTDPNITATYDVPTTLVNGVGKLGNDHEHNLKIDGFYRFDMGLSFGGVFNYLTGSPISAYAAAGNIPLGGYGEYHLLQRGSAGRLPDQTTIDLKVAYDWRIAGKYSLNLYLDVFNLFDEQVATSVIESFTQGGDYDEQVIPISGVTNADGSARFSNVDELRTYIESLGNIQLNDAYGEVLTYSSPRYYRFGVKFSF
ncbi:MAG: carboxypeptidase regulatory-like domain-containing protein [Acidobacteria bacterium]|nr:carboxypeptidase regulatory-like domain-containing protein [Acidobacteriota bacterium]